jgi:hypothetical protein
MNSEIGGEFWRAAFPVPRTGGAPGWLEFGADNRLFVSGRTALDHIILDIREGRGLRSAILPSYCCRTMIEPFRARGVRVEFYDVEPAGGGGLSFRFDGSSDPDVVFVMEYFGYRSPSQDDGWASLRSRGAVIIEDATHSLFGDRPFGAGVDYVFASTRKWAGVPGGAAASKMAGFFVIDPPGRSNEAYIGQRTAAMLAKSAYLEGKDGGKKPHLRMFEDAETMLDSDYRGYGIDAMSRAVLLELPVEEIRAARRRNARALIEAFRRSGSFRPLFTEVRDGDCPLFVPILVPAVYRDELRRRLADLGVFCPIHWPVSDLHALSERTEVLYQCEISIVCDQRYGPDDMARIAATLDRIVRSLGPSL